MPPVPTADDLRAQAAAVCAMLGEGWSAPLDGHVFILTDPEGGRRNVHFESPLWRDMAKAAARMARLEAEAAGRAARGSAW